MTRIETLLRKATKDLEGNIYRHFERNGVTPLEIARAVDRIREAEKLLRRAYDA